MPVNQSSYAKTYFRDFVKSDEANIDMMFDDKIMNEVKLDISIIYSLLNDIYNLKFQGKVVLDEILISADGVNICDDAFDNKKNEFIKSFYEIFFKKTYITFNYVEKILNKYKLNVLLSRCSYLVDISNNKNNTFTDIINNICIGVKLGDLKLYYFIQNELYDIIYKYFVYIKNYGSIILQYLKSEIKEKQFFCYQLYTELRKYRRQIDEKSKEIVFKYDTLSKIMQKERLDGICSFFNIQEIINTIDLLEEYYMFSGKQRRKRIFETIKI